LKKSKPIKYKDNKCAICDDELIPVSLNVPDTKMKCVACGAVYTNLNDYLAGHAGEFTGRYLPVDIARRYENNFVDDKQEPIK